MKKLGTVLLLALSLLSVTACGKKKDNNIGNYNCGQYGYSSTPCAYGQPGYGQPPYGQPYGGYNQCQAGSVMVNLYGQTQCLQQGPCQPGYGYHPTILNGGPGCVQGSSMMGGYQQPYGGYQQPGYYGGGYVGGQIGY